MEESEGPVSKPLTTLEQILEWQKHISPFEVATLQPRTEFSVSGTSFTCHRNNDTEWKHAELKTERVPQTLVCHDMKGGYIEDRFVNGTNTAEAYRFFHWAGIDIFVYFSHNLLTIPPPVWITASHIHGVKVLGTFITEWSAGEIVWNRILSSDTLRTSCVEKMVEICEKFGFDGYLLNVENKLEKKYINALLQFVEELHRALHEKLPSAELVWYDSITTEGKLDWQNELNALNKPFFERCDGILLNYPWREAQLAASAAAAGARGGAVFAGVDVWGRGSFGGGGFGAAEALAAARRSGLSAALFAPAWTHEALGDAHFACAEHLFWARARPHLHVRGPARLPLRTSFCQGFGRRGRARWGRRPPLPAARPWFHLGEQRLQPSTASCLDARCLPVPDRPPPPPPPKAASASTQPSAETAPESEVDSPTETAAAAGNPTETDADSPTESASATGPATDTAAAAGSPSDASTAAAAGAAAETAAAPARAAPAEPAPAPDCGGANRGCVQHFEGDAFQGGGCLQVRRAAGEGGDHLSLHRLFLCELRSASGRLRVLHAAKALEAENGDAALRLALVLRATPSADARLMWVDETPGRRVVRSTNGEIWEPIDNPNGTSQASWQVWEHEVTVEGCVVEILAGLPPGLNAALLGWLEIIEGAAQEKETSATTT